MLARRNLFNPLYEISRINRMIDSMFANMFGRDFWPSDFVGFGFGTIPVDVSETDKEYILRAELPGVDKNDIQLYCDENRVTITAEKKQLRKVDTENFVQTESYSGQISRTVTLPGEIDPNNAEASYKDGVLEVRLPKVRPGLRGRKIDIR